MNGTTDTPLYQKLPGISGGPMSRSRLWLSTDHLLRVEMRGFTETYHRFYFTDIQAIILRPTPLWYIEMAMLGPLLLVFLLLALVSADAWRVFWLIMSGVVAPFFAIKLFQGQTCVCHIQTAVQLMALPSVNRIRYARKILGLVRPMIEQAQGTMSPEEMVRELENAPPPIVPQARAPVARPRVEPVVPPQPVRRVIHHSHGRWHEITCWVLAADALWSSLLFFVDNEVIHSVGLFMFVVLLALVLTAVVKQLRTDLPRQLKYAMWSMLGYMTVGTLVVIVYTIVVAIRDPMLAGRQLSPTSDTFMLWMNASRVLASGLVAALGLVSLYRFRREYAARPEATPPDLPASADGRPANAGSRPETDAGHDGAWPSKADTP